MWNGGDAEGQRRDSQSTKSVCPQLREPSRVSVGRWPSPSSSLARTVRLGVCERGRREIVIWSPQRPRAASIACFGQECSRSLTTTRAPDAKGPHFILQKYILRVSGIFLVFFVHREWLRLNVRGVGEASRRSDIGLGRSYDARWPSQWKTRFCKNVFFLVSPSLCKLAAVACVNHCSHMYVVAVGDEMGSPI